ncbi:MAG TPA: hypothetical protein VK638_09295 [Edaphobacter sp.]|nr:hypothetical protein [Edaphobacter sp.]
MLTTEIIETITSAGGQIWLVEGKIHARLPENLRSMVNVIRSRKADLIDELALRPVMPVGVRLIFWEPKDPPVQLSRCETVTDVDKFTCSTLRQVEARLHSKGWLAGNWTLATLMDRLAAVGCHVALDDRKRALQ